MTDRLVMPLGLWSSVVVAVLGAVFLALLIGYFSTEGFVLPPTTVVQFIGGIIAFLTAPALLVLFAAIKHSAPTGRTILGALGLAFTGLLAVCVSINRFVQLPVIRLGPPGPASRDLARFLPYSTDSVIFALEILGWGFLLSLAALFVAPLFGGNRRQNSIRWRLILFALFSLMSVIGFVTATRITAGAFVAWGPILVALAILPAVHFRSGEGRPST